MSSRSQTRTGARTRARSVVVVVLAVFLSTVLDEVKTSDALGLPDGTEAMVFADAESLGLITGQLFTDRHPDSVAVGADLVLIFREGDDLRRIEGRSGSRGEFRFGTVSIDPEIQYVVKVNHRGREFLGTPISFAEGESLLEFNFLVSGEARSVDLFRSGGRSSSGDPRFGQRPDENPLTTIVIIGLLFGLFAALAYRFRRTVTGSEPSSRADRAGLMREIARLDLRFESGDLAETEYRSRRAVLWSQLESAEGALR